MIEVFHSSRCRVSKPDVSYSRKELDFGPGFYFTPLRSQAVSYAEKFKNRGFDAWLNVYDFDDSDSNWKIMKFESYDERWLEFVFECRKGHSVGDYDMIIGGIANDRVFDTLTLFFEGWLNKEETLRRLIYEKPNIQYCIRSQDMLEKCLTFKESHKL